MRQDTQAFDNKNVSASKEPLYVVEISFSADNTDLYYLTSHKNTLIPPGGLSIQDVIRNISGTSQRLNPDKAVSSIGSISFEVVDKDGSVRDLQHDKLQLGKSMREQRVRVYMGFEGLTWDDYALVQTQIIESVAYRDGMYKFACSDIQRSQRKDIFDLVKTNISQDFLIGDAVCHVYNTDAFEPLEHSSSYSDAPGQTVYYFKIEDEIIRATGKTATTFTGCVRGVLNTKEADHKIDPDSSQDRRPEVDEYVYLELPAPKLAYAILTGELLGQGGARLPNSWHLNIDLQYVFQAEFANIGPDLYDATLEDGFVCRFEGVKKQDGKKFLESELYLLMGCFSPIYTDGRIGLRRMASVLSSSPHVFELNETNVDTYSELKHRMQDMHNFIRIHWNWVDSKESFTRTNDLYDINSIAVHGLADKIDFKFRGLNGSRHSSEILNERFNSIRDRYTGPPLTMSVTCLASVNKLEVGDVVRVNLNTVRDFVAGGSLDRAFEIQNISIDWVSGKVTLQLFASSQPATVNPSVNVTTVIPDSFYSLAGNNLATYIGAGYDFNTHYENIGGVGHIKSSCSLEGGNDLTNATYIYYHIGDLIIDPGVVLSWNDNIQLRVMGHITYNGGGDGVAAGLPGAFDRMDLDQEDPRYTAGALPNHSELNIHNSGLAGFIGPTVSDGGTLFTVGCNNNGISCDGYVPDWTFRATLGNQTPGLVQTVPNLSIEYKNNQLLGVPKDLRGSSGASGGNFEYMRSAANFGTAHMGGGAGGNGGGGLFVLCRGASFGVSGYIDTSGGDSQLGSLHPGGSYPSGGSTTVIQSHRAGAGAPGAPGAVYFCLDGSTATIPDLDKVTACFGKVPAHNGVVLDQPAKPFLEVSEVPIYPYYQALQCPITDLSGYNGGSRIQFVIGSEAAEQDANVGKIKSPSGLVLSSGTNDLLLNSDGTVIARIKGVWNPSPDPRTVGYEVQYKKSVDTVWFNAADVIGEIQGYVSPVQDGVDYDARIRAADSLRNTSDWVTVTNHNVIGKTAPPSDVTGFRVYFNNGNVVFKWSPVSDRDLNGYEIRYEKKNSAIWDNGIRLTIITKGTNVTSSDVPDGDWTFMIKAVDTSGNYSVNVASFDLLVVSDYDIITTQAEHPRWLGQLTGLVKTFDNKLILDGTVTAENQGWETFDEFNSDPVAIGYYETASEVDYGFDGDIRVWASIGSHLGPGVVTGNAEPGFQIDHRLNAGAYDGYEDWSIGSLVGAAVKGRIKVDSSVGLPVIDSFEFNVDALEFTQRGENVTVPATGLAITFPQPFHLVPSVRVFIRGAVALTPTRDQITETGFTAHVFDNTSEVGGVIDWDATGV